MPFSATPSGNRTGIISFMKKSAILVIVVGILILGYLFVKEKDSRAVRIPQDISVKQEVVTEKPDQEKIVSDDFIAPDGTPGTLINKCASTQEKFVEIMSPQNWEVYKPGDTLRIKWAKCNSEYRHVVAIHGFEILDEGYEGPKTGAIYLGCYDNMNGQASWVIPEKLNKGDVSCGYSITKDLDFTSKRYHFFITVASSQEDGVVDETEIPFVIDAD